MKVEPSNTTNRTNLAETVNGGEGLTHFLAERACTYATDKLPEDVITRVIQCFTDWVSVTVAAAGDPIHAKLFTSLQPEAAAGPSSIVGHAERYCPSFAALVNGTTSHILDFDDVNLAISGHPSAVVASASLALAESCGKSGADLIAAYIAGYETACAVGTLLCPNIMDRGFHATGTVGSLGAAAACGHLLGFNTHEMAAALGLAGTQAAGVKAMFGTMVKPLHAGMAARVGVESALLVRNGFEGRTDVLDHRFGFARTHSSDFHPDLVLNRDPADFHIRNNLFKYDASCYGTHAAIECVRRLQAQNTFAAADVRAVHIRADRSVDGICNIQNPKTGLEGKFSVRLNVAFVLLGIDTGKFASYTDEYVNNREVRALMDRVEIELIDQWPSMQAEVTIETNHGKRFTTLFDAGIPSQDLAEQERRVNAKFEALVGAVLDEQSTGTLLHSLHNLRHLPDVRTLLKACCGSSPDNK